MDNLGQYPFLYKIAVITTYLLFAYSCLVYGLTGNFQLVYANRYVLIAASFVVNIALYNWSDIKALNKN